MRIANNDILLSIICTAYNHEAFIRDAIEGFLMQKTNFPIEILIHDDASTDGTADIIREYEMKHPDKIFAIYQSENQYSKGNKPGRINRNRARGKYIAICEGDDYWTDPYKLQKQIDFLEVNEDYSMCFHPARIIDSGFQKSRYHLYKDLQNRDYDPKEILLKWTIPTASVVYRALCIPYIENNSNQDYLYGDIVLFLSCAEYGKIRCINEEMSVYRVHPKGISSKTGLDKNLKFVKHHKAIQRGFGGKYKRVTNPLISRTYLKIGDIYYRERKIIKAVVNYLQGFRYDRKVFFARINEKLFYNH